MAIHLQSWGGISLIKTGQAVGPLPSLGPTTDFCLGRLREATEWAQAAIASAQEQQEKNANTRRQPSDQFKPGDKVWLRLRSIRSDRPCKKLDWLSAKYTVLETIGSHACRLDTPPGIHNVFHVSLLRLAAEDPLPSLTSDDCRPPAILTDEGELWEVEEILDERKVGREWKVLVKWVGWIGPTWEPVKYVADTIAFANRIKTTSYEREEKEGVVRATVGQTHVRVSAPLSTKPHSHRYKNAGAHRRGNNPVDIFQELPIVRAKERR
ncbi:reverse transcriptase (RNA-dependent DNA polymerase) [Hirsutella rhossiliensis]